jgi:hypothetical protein
VSIDMMGNSRAPSHRKPKLPPMSEIAERIVAGELLEDLAAEYDRHHDNIRQRLNTAGFSATTGFPLEEPTTVVDLPLLLGQVFRYEPWRDEALCAQTDPDSFFPEKGGSTREAKAVCTRCPVQAECVDEALANGERYGIWGGLSERERRKITRHNQQSAQHHHLDNQQEPA